MIDDYNEKRRFMRTPEPFGERGDSDPDHLIFVVQRHFAKRPHFDLRLELDGVLKSWAVPEGPSLDPAHKRLAVATEDHPISYADFEGLVPKDEYGAGAIFIGDRGTWVSMEDDPAAALASGELKFQLSGERLNGGWMLKKLPKGEKEWLLIKERDRFVEKGFSVPKERAEVVPETAILPGEPGPMPKRLKPQLATAVDSPPDGEEWLHEIKYDGYRTFARKAGDDVSFFTRNGLNWTEKYEALVPAFAALDCESALIDGEIAAQDARGATSFEKLQQALSLGRDQDLIFYAFDIVHCNGNDLTRVPLATRKAILRRLIPQGSDNRLLYSDHVVGDGRQLFSQVCRLGLEGVVSKKSNAPYRQGRTHSWVKAKRFEIGTFDIIGFTTKASSRHVASLMLAETADETSYVGRAGTGLTLDETRSYFDKFSSVEIDAPAIAVPKTQGAHFVEPGRYMAEISYRGRTTKGHLRQAAILSIKETAKPNRGRSNTMKLITDRDLANIRLTNPDREIFKGSGTTKQDLAVFYARVGDRMLTNLLDRTVSLIRSPSGSLDDVFYQRHGFPGLPDGVETIKDGDSEYLVIRTPRGFLGLPQFGVIEFHPWDCRTSDMDHPDRMTVDLDPGEEVEWSTVVSGANAVRDRLYDLGLASFVRTTGGKGAHVVVPLAGKDDWAKVRQFLKALARQLADEMPRLFTDLQSKAKRKGRIYIDINRTTYGTSAVASYSLRATPEFQVAMPLAWQDFHTGTPPTVFNRRSALSHVERQRVDPWNGFADARQPISAKALKGVGLKG